MKIYVAFFLKIEGVGKMINVAFNGVLVCMQEGYFLNVLLFKLQINSTTNWNIYFSKSVLDSLVAVMYV